MEQKDEKVYLDISYLNVLERLVRVEEEIKHLHVDIKHLREDMKLMREDMKLMREDMKLMREDSNRKFNYQFVLIGFGFTVLATLITIFNFL